MSSRFKHVYEFGPFRLVPSERMLWRDGRTVPLRPKVFDTLLVLVENSGRLVEKDELMRALWPGQFVEEGNLNKNISMLRLSLGENGSGKKYIETVPKRGYRFAADVHTVDGEVGAEMVIETRSRASLIFQEETEDEDLAGDGGAVMANTITVRPTTATTAVPVARSTGALERLLKSRAVAATAVLTVLLAALAYIFYPEVRGGNAIDSVAVLPFANESGDPEAEYLSDGISESLINSLSQLPGMKVTARISSFKYKGKDVDPKEAARSLGVQALLTGRILRRGDSLLIRAELTDARDGTHVWGEQYNRKESDLLAVQSEISGEIARALRLHLTPVQQRQLAKRETVNPQAYELLLRGRFYWKKGTTEDQKKALDYFKQAIEIDPAYALAYAQLSSAYESLVNANVLDPKEFTPKAVDTAHKALELDESLAEAHLAVAGVKEDAWEWEAAEREIKRAIELNPNLATAHIVYTFYNTIRGRYEQALTEAKRARELDPLSIGANAVVVYGLMLARQDDQAIEAAKKMLELDESNPNVHGLLGQAYTGKGQHTEAISAWQEAIRLGDDSPDAQIFLGAAYARAGESAKARAILKRLEKGKEYVSPAALAILHIALGQQEQALALLERAYSAHDQQLIWLGVETQYSPIRSDPRFQDLLRRIGLSS